jgi:hypothetical protein
MLERAGIVALLLTMALPGVSNTTVRHGCGDGQAAVQAQIEAACPCAATASRTAYLHCVNDKLKELSGCRKAADGAPVCRPVSRSCASAARRTASGSVCGETATVACCIPRQHDCVNDKKLADGKKEGTCRGTDRPCDGMADCKIPRCRSASSAERCVQIGGTLGTTKDCSTACAP